MSLGFKLVVFVLAVYAMSGFALWLTEPQPIGERGISLVKTFLDARTYSFDYLPYPFNAVLKYALGMVLALGLVLVFLDVVKTIGDVIP